MKLKVYRSTWGLVDDSDGKKAKSPFHTYDEALPELKRLGYDGVEIPLKFILYYGKDKFKKLLKDTGLKVIIMVMTDGPVAPGDSLPLFGGPYPGFTKSADAGETDKDKLVRLHLDSFKEQVEAAQELSPTSITAHSLKDYFTHDMAAKYFEEALRWTKEKGYVVHHENHRKRFLYSPWGTRDFLLGKDGKGRQLLDDEFNLTMVADLSHWINVAETDTNDPDLTAVIEALAPRFRHIHLRVGYDHGPQVPDPRTKNWLPYTEGHERWWDAIWKEAEKRGDEEVTVTTEFGPPNYQVCNPQTEEPLADIWDVNHWIALRRQERFKELFGADGSSNLVASKTQDENPKTNPGKSNLDGKKGLGVDVGFF